MCGDGREDGLSLIHIYYLLDWVEKMMIDYETYYIIIDEVQAVEDFVEVLSSLSVTEGADVYVTGSNSRRCV